MKALEEAVGSIDNKLPLVHKAFHKQFKAAVAAQKDLAFEKRRTELIVTVLGGKHERARAIQDHGTRNLGGLPGRHLRGR